MKEFIERAAKAVGSQTKLGEALGVTQQNISYWKGAGIPVEYGAAIELATNAAVTRQEIWPDSWQKYWPELAPSLSNIAQPATETVAPPVDPIQDAEPLRTGAHRRQGGRREKLPVTRVV